MSYYEVVEEAQGLITELSNVLSELSSRIEVVERAEELAGAVESETVANALDEALTSKREMEEAIEYIEECLSELETTLDDLVDAMEEE